MSSSALAEKQLPRWEIEAIESTSPSQEQRGPSDMLERARPFANLVAASSMGAVQSPKRHVYISFAQESVGVPFRLEKADSPDISASQLVTFQPASTSEWYEIPDFAFKIRPTSEEAKVWIAWSIEPSGQASSFQFESTVTAKSRPAEALQNRYKELSSKRYMDSLTTDERVELKNIEEQLDELDTQDTDLKTFIGQLDEGYAKLRRGLTEINGILDELLRH
jgi:hypothetical protein